MKKIVSILFSAFVVSVFLIGVITPDRASSKLENRELRGVPRFSFFGVLDKTYTGDFEEYLIDQFPLRDRCILTHQYISMLKNHSSSGDFVTIEGNNGYNYAVFDDKNIISYYTKKKDRDVAYNWIDKITELSDLCKENDKNLFFAVAPSKAEALNSMLPEKFQNDKDSEVFKLIKSHIPENVNVIDIISEFEKIPTDRLQNYYFFTDPHWNFIGSYEGLKIIGSELSKCTELDTDISVFEMNAKGSKQDGFVGMYNQFFDMKYSKEENLIRYLPKDESIFKDMRIKAKSLDDDEFVSEKTENVLFTKTEGDGITYNTMCVSDYGHLYIQNPNALNDYSLLVIKDSFFDALVPNINLIFKEVHIVDTRMWTSFNVEEFIDTYKTDGILLCYNSNAFFKVSDHLNYSIRRK